MESSFTNALEWTSLSEQSNQPISGGLIKNRVYRNHSLVIVCLWVDIKFFYAHFCLILTVAICFCSCGFEMENLYMWFNICLL